MYLMKRQSAPPMVSGILASARMRSHCVASRFPDKTKACDSRQCACVGSQRNAQARKRCSDDGTSHFSGYIALSRHVPRQAQIRYNKGTTKLTECIKWQFLQPESFTGPEHTM